MLSSPLTPSLVRDSPKEKILCRMVCIWSCDSENFTCPSIWASPRNVSSKGYMDASSLTLGSSSSCKSMEMEIQLLLKKLLDITSLDCNFQSSFTGLVREKHTLASYSFSGLQLSNWLYLDSKLIHDCRLVKQLPVSECSHDDIKQLEWVNFQQCKPQLGLEISSLEMDKSYCYSTGSFFFVLAHGCAIELILLFLNDLFKDV